MKAPIPSCTIALIVSAKRTAQRVVVENCRWEPSFSFHDRSGRIQGPANRYWSRHRDTMRLVAGNWVLTTIKTVGKCPGGAP